MFDSLGKVTTVLSGGLGTTVSSTAINLGASSSSAVGGPVLQPLVMEINCPSNPTGTTPSIAAVVQDSTDGTNFYTCGTITPTNTTTTGFPKNFRARFTPRYGAKVVRVQFTLANTDNVYGSVVAKLGFGVSERSN